MKLAGVAVLPVMLVFALGVAHSKPKKPAVSQMFEHAHFVYVEGVDGDALRPDLYPEDRQAIFDLQDRLRDWKRYAITQRREQADLIFVVRKGRLVGQQDHVRVGPRPQSAQPGIQNPGQMSGQTQSDPRNQGSSGGGGELGAAAEVGPPVDMLRVYTLTADGKLMGPIWSREMEDGLSRPAVQLLQQLEEAVDRVYPPQAARQSAP